MNAHAIGKSIPDGIAAGANKPSATSLCDAGDDKYKNNKTNNKRKVSRPHCFAARHHDAPLQAPKLSALGEFEFLSSDGVEKVRVMLAKRNCVQPYSAMYIDGVKVIVLWDSGCTLPGLMCYKRFMKFLRNKGEDVVQVRWYAKPQPVSGLSDPPAMMVGEAIVTLRLNGRYVKVLVCIIKDGDVGKADILIGNAYMWSDHWGGCIDCDEPYEVS